jgi:hypothetical protein
MADRHSSGGTSDPTGPTTLANNLIYLAHRHPPLIFDNLRGMKFTYLRAPPTTYTDVCTDRRHGRLQSNTTFADQCQSFPGPAQGLGNGIGDVPRSAAAADNKDAAGGGSYRVKLEVPFLKEAVRPAADVKQPGYLLSIRAWLQGDAQDNHIHGDPEHTPDQGIFADDNQFPLLFFSQGMVSDRGCLSPDKVNAPFGKALVEFLVALPEAAHVNIHLIHLGAGMFPYQVSILKGIHTAHPRAVFMVILIPAADAMDDSHAFRFSTVL